MDRNLPRLRSALFVPGIREDFMRKALGSGADALVLDLEDSVPPAAKDEARRIVADNLRNVDGPPALVRINSPREGVLSADFGALVPGRLLGIVVPKVEGTDDLAKLEEKLSAFERLHSLSANVVSLIVSVETCLGLRSLYDVISRSPRVRGAGLASAEEGDLMVDIGGEWTPGGEALAYARGRFVCEARAAGAEWLLDGAFMNLKDDEALRRECRIARTCGFNGKFAIHPRQVAVINDVFSPSPAEVERAHALLEAFRQAEATGRGAVQFRGMMVDYANVKRAEQIISLAGHSPLSGEAGGVPTEGG
jgi:citrate lyase subunit beta / citryl-CoA lyase